MSIEVIQLYWLKKNNDVPEDNDKPTKQTMNIPTWLWWTAVLGKELLGRATFKKVGSVQYLYCRVWSKQYLHMHLKKDIF